jgi:hypothetical protein
MKKSSAKCPCKGKLEPTPAPQRKASGRGGLPKGPGIPANRD